MLGNSWSCCSTCVLLEKCFVVFYVFSFPPGVYVGTINLIASIPGPSIFAFLPGPTSCADPEIFMRGGPRKMIIFGHRRGRGPTPQKSRNYLFLSKIFKFQGGGSGPPVPPSGSAHELNLTCAVTEEKTRSLEFWI